jgi:hypothetical protein
MACSAYLWGMDAKTTGGDSAASCKAGLNPIESGRGAVSAEVLGAIVPFAAGRLALAP